MEVKSMEVERNDNVRGIAGAGLGLEFKLIVITWVTVHIRLDNIF